MGLTGYKKRKEPQPVHTLLLEVTCAVALSRQQSHPVLLRDEEARMSRMTGREEKQAMTVCSSKVTLQDPLALPLLRRILIGYLH